MNIEEQFFKAFGIEKIKYEIPSREYDDDGKICSYYVEEQYPEITAERLLELLDILRTHFECYFWGNFSFDLIRKHSSHNGFYECEYRTGGNIKEIIISSFVAMKDKLKKEVKNQVRKVFEGE